MLCSFEGDLQCSTNLEAKWSKRYRAQYTTYARSSMVYLTFTSPCQDWMNPLVKQDGNLSPNPTIEKCSCLQCGPQLTHIFTVRAMLARY